LPNATIITRKSAVSSKGAIMLKSLHHVGVAVKDMERSLAFYQKTLGATVGLDIEMDIPEFGAGVGIPGAKARVVFLQIPGLPQQFELLEYRSPSGRPMPPDHSNNTLGSAHVAFQVADIKETYELFVKKGVHFISKPSAFPADHPVLGGVAFCFFQDPDGTLLELIQVPQ
jgi:catechol 2,3-dioxygenase-like lactoylglutathione lyase family enzyme